MLSLKGPSDRNFEPHVTRFAGVMTVSDGGGNVLEHVGVEAGTDLVSRAKTHAIALGAQFPDDIVFQVGGTRLATKTLTGYLRDHVVVKVTVVYDQKDVDFVNRGMQ